jgi:ganglioside-induced differentiation-associated protein 1
MLKLYQGRTAVCSVKVRLTMAEKGLDFEPVNLDLRAGEQHKPEYLKLNPNGVVPTLIHDDFVLIESSVIMQYLDENFPGQSLQLTEPKARARMRIWMKRIDEYLHPSIGALIYAMVHAASMRKMNPAELEAHYRAIPNPATRELQRAAIEHGMDAPAAVQALQAYDKAFANMELQLAERPWLAGDGYSLADAAMTPYINRLAMLGLSNMWALTRPDVSAWFERIKARSSFDKAITTFVTDADLKPYAELDTWAWRKAEQLLKAA